MTKQHSIGSSDTKNSVIKFIVNVLPETYIPSYVTVAIVGTEVKVVTEVTIFFTVVTAVTVWTVVRKIMQPLHTKNPATSQLY